MAASMQRITAGELIDLLEDMEETEYIGYIFTVQDFFCDPKVQTHQVLVFNKSIIDV